MTSAANSGPEGLTSAEAVERLHRYGPNTMPEPRRRPVLDFLRKLTGPVPWMLQATLVLEVILRKAVEAAIIVGLLLLNACVTYIQERRAQGALALLRKRIPVSARVRRDGAWKLIASAQLVPDDVVHVRIGDLMPADVRVIQGEVLLDESSLTGESMPAERRTGDIAYSGAIVRRGEATGRVTATGTRFGKTAELVRLAGSESHLQTLIVRIVKYLIVLDTALAALVIADALARRSPMEQVLPFVLMLLVASVPIALPATFSLATALGATELAERGALVTRLSAVEEAAAMDVLCSDKTGTLTQNRLSLERLVAYRPYTEDELLRLATYTCDEATQDPLDLAILLRARALASSARTRSEERLRFVPFDPATKRAEAVVKRGESASSKVRRRQ